MGQNQRIIRWLSWVVFLILLFVWGRKLAHRATLTTGQEPAAQVQIDTNAPVIKVAVFADGHITADGSPTPVDSLRESFKKLAGQKGSVWLYQDIGQGKPSSQTVQVSIQVVKAISEARLPVRISSHPDYSDAITFDGKRIQR